MHPWRKSGVGRALVLFGATYAALLVAGFVGMRRVPALGFARQEVAAVRFPDPSWFSVWFRGGTQLDHTILWNGIGPSLENARRADVVFLGTSQMQFGIPDHELRAFEKRTGLSVFSLALPFGEAYVFPLHLIEEYDLRPRIVVVNAPSFFRPFESAAARAIREDRYWAGLATVWEERLAAIVWPVASPLFPSFVTRRAPQSLLRSSADGTWMPVRWPHDHVPVGMAAAPIDADPASIRRVRNAFAGRGAQLVVTCVPSPFKPCGSAEVLALAAGVGGRAVVPKVDKPLWSGDIAHLCPLSGKRFGRALFRDLEKLDIVKAITLKRPRGRPPLRSPPSS